MCSSDLDEQALFDEVQTLRAILREHPDEIGPLQVEVELETPVRPSAKYYARILDESGRVVIENSRMQRALLNATAFPEPREIIQSLGRPTTWRSPGGRTFLLTTARAQWGSPSRGRRTIQLALEVTREETMLARYRGWLGLVLFIGVVASAAAGVSIARNGLKPLQQITRAAQGIERSLRRERNVELRTGIR